MDPSARPSTGHYFETDPAAAPRPATVTLTLPDMTLRLGTDSGVFSGGAVDAGTKLLLLEASEVPGGPAVLLDLGCGYGPIAVALARRAPAATVWAVDVNERARALCAANAEAAGVGERVRVAAPDEVPDEVRFDGIWSNPPIRVGKAALHDILTAWLGRLAAGGSAHLVVQKHLGADSLARWLGDQGWSTERAAARSGYRVLTVARPPDGRAEREGAR